MMKEEFEKRIGLVITSEEYAGIEAAYMGLPEAVDKEKFVKIWLHEGGIQDLFDKRLAKTMALKETVKGREEEIMEWVRNLNAIADERDALKAQMKALDEKIAAISGLIAA
jgi:hypothetical protein